MGQKLIFICLLLLGATWENPDIQEEYLFKAEQIWDDNRTDPIVGDVLGFVPKKAPDTIVSWPEYAVKRFVRLDESVQKAIADRKKQAEIDKLKETPYSTIKRPLTKQWEIENSWMSQADREAMIWDKDPLTFNRKQGSRYLYLNIPQYSYYTKMFVYGEDAELVQDFQGHGAITKFDETKLLRVDVFDGRGYIGTAYNAPVAKWIRKLSYADFGMAAGTTIDIIGIAEDLNDNYVIQFTSQPSGGNKSLNLAYFKRDGELVWHQTYTGTGVSYYTGKTGTLIIDKDHDVVCTFAIKDTPSDSDTKQFKIKNGNEKWTFSDAYITYDVAQLKDGGYVLVETETETDPTIRRMIRLDADGNKINWGNGKSGVTDDVLYSYTNAVLVSNDGNIYTGSKSKYIQKYDDQGNLTWSSSVAPYPVIAVAEGHDCNIAYILSDTDERVYIVSPNGTGRFNKEIYPSGTGHIYSIFACNDDGYVCAGDLNSGDSQVIKLSSTGKIEFKVDFESMDFNDAIETNDGGYLAVGGAYIVKTNRYGESCSKGEPCE